MSLSFHPLAELDRLLSNSQGNLLKGTLRRLFPARYGKALISFLFDNLSISINGLIHGAVITLRLY